jgi:prophage antirepressor-like protein
MAYKFFSRFPIRILGDASEPFFYAQDIINLFELNSTALQLSSDDILQGDRSPNALILTECGVHTLAQASNSFVANKFKNAIATSILGVSDLTARMSNMRIAHT